jgi:hypothetical protein
MVFIVENSLNNLSQLEALVLVNAWTKLKNYWLLRTKRVLKLSKIKLKTVAGLTLQLLLV